MPKVGRKEVKEVGCGIAADWNHPLLHLARFIGRSGHWRTTIVWLRSKNHVRGCRTCGWTSLCADSLAANSPTGSNNICDPKSIFTLPRLSFTDTRRATKNLKCPPPNTITCFHSRAPCTCFFTGFCSRLFILDYDTLTPGKLLRRDSYSFSTSSVLGAWRPSRLLRSFTLRERPPSSIWSIFLFFLF